MSIETIAANYDRFSGRSVEERAREVQGLVDRLEELLGPWDIKRQFIIAGLDNLGTEESRPKMQDIFLRRVVRQERITLSAIADGYGQTRENMRKIQDLALRRFVYRLVGPRSF